MKRIAIILFLIILSLTIKAQYPEYGIGLKGGTTWSFMWFNPSISQPSMPLTFHAGAQFRMVSERYFGIKIELNYAQRAGDLKNLSTDDPHSCSTDLVAAVVEATVA